MTKPQLLLIIHAFYTTFGGVGTAAILSSLMALFAALLIITVSTIRKNKGSASYQKRLDALSKVEASLVDVKAFVVEEKDNLASMEKRVNELLTIDDHLKESMTITRSQVDALLFVQNIRPWKDRLKEWGIGFLIGILSETSFYFLIQVLVAKK